MLRVDAIGKDYRRMRNFMSIKVPLTPKQIFCRPESGLSSYQFMHSLLHLLRIFKLKVAAVLRHRRVLMTMGPSSVCDVGLIMRIDLPFLSERNGQFLERVRWILPHRCVVREAENIGDSWPEVIKRRKKRLDLVKMKGAAGMIPSARPCFRNI